MIGGCYGELHAKNHAINIPKKRKKFVSPHGNTLLPSHLQQRVFVSISSFWEISVSMATALSGRLIRFCGFDTHWLIINYMNATCHMTDFFYVLDFLRVSSKVQGHMREQYSTCFSYGPFFFEQNMSLFSCPCP